MATKERAKQLIDQLPDQLPDGARIREIIYALYVRDQFERGERRIREGNGIDQKELKREAARWRK